MKSDCELLEEAYNNVTELDDIEDLLSEGAFEQMDKLFNSIKNVSSNLPEFLGNLGSYFKQAAIIGLGAGIAAQLIGWIFIGISKLLNKDIEFEEKIRQRVADELYAQKSEKIDAKSLTSEELYTAYKDIEIELGETLDEKFPIKGKTRWALVLNKVGHFMKNKIGTSAFAIAGLATYFRMSDVPAYGMEPEVGQGGGWAGKGPEFQPTHIIDVDTGTSTPINR